MPAFQSDKAQLGSRHALFTCLVGAVLASGVMGCSSSTPSLFLQIEDPDAVQPQQLRVTLERPNAQPERVVRPEVAGAPLTASQSLRLFLPPEAIGGRVELWVEALTDGEVLATAAGTVSMEGGEETVRLVLRASEGPIAGTPCDPTRTPCAEGLRCDAGSCVPEDTGEPEPPQECTVPDDCALELQQCEVAACVDGTCRISGAKTGTSCDDGSRCTEDDTCNAQGQCVSGPEKVCQNTSNACQEAIGECIPSSGQCVFMTINEGGSCDVENPCYTSTCQSGSCLATDFACTGFLACCLGAPTGPEIPTLSQQSVPQYHCTNEPPNNQECYLPPF